MPASDAEASACSRSEAERRPGRRRTSGWLAAPLAAFIGGILGAAAMSVLTVLGLRRGVAVDFEAMLDHGWRRADGTEVEPEIPATGGKAVRHERSPPSRAVSAGRTLERGPARLRAELVNLAVALRRERPGRVRAARRRAVCALALALRDVVGHG
jgi:hypothetical protein